MKIKQRIFIIIKSILIICSPVIFTGLIQAKDVTITIHLRGVYESNITLLPLSGKSAQKSIAESQSIKNGATTTLEVSEENLPGEFVLRFDYKENPLSTPYPAEKHIVLNDQDLEIWIHPVFSNNPDSTWFQKDERENTVLIDFLQGNLKQKKMLSLLQNFLLNYDDVNSSIYKDGITEYEKRRKICNQWIAAQIKEKKSLFIRNLFIFEHIPQINWRGSEAERKKSLRDNYFEGIDFREPLMLKTSNMKSWLDGYVNLFGESVTNVSLRDSLFTLAGKIAIEKSKKGDPLVYGWVVDYFFEGYESFNIESGIKMLEPYLDDPNCLTSKRLEINKRLDGIKALVPGTKAPNIIMQDTENNQFVLNSYQTDKKYILLLFWSAGCSHCLETVGQLYPMYMTPEVKHAIDVIAISIDNTEYDIQAWEEKKEDLPGWIHMRASEGVRSKVGNDYYILSVPIMVLLNAKTKEIIAIPDSPDKLKSLLSQ